MTVRQVWVLRGPNIWARVPVLEAWLQRDRPEENSAATNPAVPDRITELVRVLSRTRPCRRKPTGLLDSTGGPAELVARLALELQSVGEPVLDFWKAWDQTPEDGTSRVVIQFREEAMGRAALTSACEMVRAFLDDQPYDVEGAVGRLNDLAYDVLLGQSTQAIVDAAQARGIPWCRLNEANLVMFGQGIKQRRILTAETDRTGAIAEAIAKDKELTRSMLQAVGVPVPDGRPVTSPEDAWEAAQDLEGPVVVKPRDANHGRGVALNLTTREEVVAAYQAALKEGDEGVLVERFAPGFDHRLLVVGNTLVAAARREPPSVVGDGKATIAALIDRANADPLRGDGFITPLKVIPLDDGAVALLAEHGYTPDSIPPAGVRVPVGRKINFFNGGIAIDVTDRVHPEVAVRAVEAARVVGLDVAGLDVVAIDVSRPLEEQGGVVVEVNAGPGLQMHLYPSASPRPVGEAIIEHMFPDGEDGQVPIVAVTGALGATLTARLIAHILQTDGRRVGLACSEGIEFEGRRIKAGDCSGAQGARTLLLNPLVEAAVCETSPHGVLTSGLGFDQCRVAVILDPAEGPHRQESQELGAVERTVAGSVIRWGGTVVLNADDPRASSVVNSGSIPVTFFARDADDPLVVQSQAGGGSAVVVRRGSIVVASRESEEPVIDLHHLPMVRQDGDGFRIEDALAGVTAAFALNASREAIRVGLETFVAPALGIKDTAKETSA